jgi:polysaccharide pyruvyl transferase CsaB
MENLNKKPLKILMLTDKLSIGGAETHILTLVRGLSAVGHSVTVVSSGGALEALVAHKKINVSTHSPKLFFSFFELLAFARREKFDIIHSHARLPSLLGSMVAKILNIPFVTTVHARFKLSPFRRAFSRWGIRSVAVSEDLSAYLSRRYSISGENITVIENGLDFSSFKPVSRESSAHGILFLSRLDHDCSLCAELLCSISPRLCERYPDITITIGGGGEHLEYIRSLAKKANSSLNKEVVQVVGEVCDASSFLSKGSIFVGVSRAALEAVASGLPVIIAGNEGFSGHLNRKNFSSALSANLCARGEDMPTADKLFCSLCALLDSYPSERDEAYSLRDIAKERLDISIFCDRYEKFYYDSIALYRRKLSKKAQTLLFGYYGYSNLGDDALLRASILRAEREFGEGVAAFTHAPKKASRIFLIPCFSRLSPFSLFYRISRCKRLIFGGGTLFQDITSRRSLLFYIIVLRLALFLKKDVLLYANGIGNIKSPRLSSWLYRSLSRCSYIGVRDSLSLSSLRKNLSQRALENLHFEKDLAHILIPSSPSKADYLLRSAFSSLPPNFFIVCPRAISRFSKFELSLAIRDQIKKGLVPLFIPCSPNDLYISLELLSKFGGAILQDLSYSDLLSILPYSSFLISMRYHPLVASKILSIPSLALGDDPKLKNL